MDMYDKIDWKETMNESDGVSDEDLDNCYMNKYLEDRFSPTKDTVSIETDFKESAVTNPNQLPKVPGAQFSFNHRKMSRFNTAEHIIFNRALKVIMSGRKNINHFEKKDIEIYNCAKAKILIENKEFLNLAESNWKGTFARKPLRIKPTVNSYATTRRMHKLLMVLNEPPFYKAVNLLPFSYNEGETPIEMIHTANVLDVGKVAKFLPPTLKEHFALKVISLPKLEYNPTVSSRLPVTKDKNISWIIDKHNVDIVIAFSSLKRLINFTDHTQRWDIPVVIKEVLRRDNKGQEKMETVVYIEKPLPALQPTTLDLNENCTKQMMKTNFCCVEAFTYESEDIQVSEPKKQEFKEDIVLSEKEEDFKYVKTKQHLNHSLILNRFYKLWSLKPKEEDTNCLLKRNMKSREFGVLIRGKVDGCEVNENGTLQAITVVPKMEFQLSFGGTIFTKKELANHWTQLYFKPYSNLYRVRAHFYSSELITMEPTNIDKVKNEAQQHYSYKPQLGIGVLYKLFHELSKYSPGNYLMKYEPKCGAFVALYQEVKDEESCEYNLHKTYKTEGKIQPNFLKPWTPIDPMVLLPKYELDGHTPGLFKPKRVLVIRKLDPKLQKVLKNRRKSKMKKAKAAQKKKLELEAEKLEY